MPSRRLPKRSMSLLHHRRQLQDRQTKRRPAPIRESVAARVPTDSSQDGSSSENDWFGEPSRPLNKRKKRQPRIENHVDERKPAAVSNRPLHDNSETDSDSNSSAQKPATKRRRTTRKGSKSKPQSTELSAAGQILVDEVHAYVHEHNAANGDNAMCNPSTTEHLSSGERRQLTTWADAVQKRIQHQSELILENIDLVSDLRKRSNQVTNLRDDLVSLRTKTRAIEEEARELEKKLEQTQQDKAARQGADRFLTALESLAKACRK